MRKSSTEGNLALEESIVETEFYPYLLPNYMFKEQEEYVSRLQTTIDESVKKGIEKKLIDQLEESKKRWSGKITYLEAILEGIGPWWIIGDRLNGLEEYLSNVEKQQNDNSQLTSNEIYERVSNITEKLEKSKSFQKIKAKDSARVDNLLAKLKEHLKKYDTLKSPTNLELTTQLSNETVIEKDMPKRQYFSSPPIDSKKPLEYKIQRKREERLRNYPQTDYTYAENNSYPFKLKSLEYVEKTADYIFHEAPSKALSTIRDLGSYFHTPKRKPKKTALERPERKPFFQPIQPFARKIAYAGLALGIGALALFYSKPSYENRSNESKTAQVSSEQLAKSQINKPSKQISKPAFKMPEESTPIDLSYSPVAVAVRNKYFNN
jgi:hypothetical protein